MRQKCEGWREEVEKLFSLEEEAKRLREENVELGQQLAQMVELGEKEKLAEENESGQHAFMEQLSALREVRVKNEEELLKLREERASILNENAALREGNDVQNYIALKKKFQEVSGDVRLFRELNHELNLKLQIATDGAKLRPIQEKMDRYKKERDTARTELETLREEVAHLKKVCHVASEELTSAMEENDTLRDRLLKKKTYSEERYKSREKAKESEDRVRDQHHQQRLHHHHRHQHHHHTSAAANPAELQHHDDSDDELGRSDHIHVEGSTSPVREYRHASPDQFSLTSEVRHKDATSPTPSLEDSLSPSPLPGATPITAPVTSSSSRGKSRSSEAGHGISSRTDSFTKPGTQGGLVEVKTKDGVVVKTVQKPPAPLNPKFKPRVVVKRSEGYEAGILMYTGRLNDKEVAGVYSEIRQKSKNYFTILVCLITVPPSNSSMNWLILT